MLRWLLVGSVTVGIDWLVFVNVYPKVKSVALANLISGFLSTSFNYIAHHHWTFWSKQRHLESGVRYVIALLFGYVLNTTLLKIFIVAGLLAGLSKALASGIQAPISYLILNFFVFRVAK
jgi:putative flippase GtrA